MYSSRAFCRGAGLKRAAVLLAASVSCQILLSEDSRMPKVSTFAPADDLAGQIDFFIGSIEKALADPEDFTRAKQSRVWKDSNTLAALALVLGAHDEPHPHKSSMPQLLKGAQALSTAEDDVGRAVTSLATIRAARAGTAQSGEAVKWEKAASLPALMKQVPLVHSRLQRGVRPNRLARLAEQSAGQSATLAAIAQVAILDDEYTESPEEARAWTAFCVEMRDAAGEVNSAVRAGDQSRVDAGMRRLLKSCEACHAKFRQQ